MKETEVLSLYTVAGDYLELRERANRLLGADDLTEPQRKKRIDEVLQTYIALDKTSSKWVYGGLIPFQPTAPKPKNESVKITLPMA